MSLSLIHPHFHHFIQKSAPFLHFFHIFLFRKQIFPNFVPFHAEDAPSYDIEHNRFVPIDYGCILNTATFDYPMSQLTSTDTILWSDLFHHISHDVSQTVLHNAVKNIRISYETNIKRSENQIKEIVDILPSQWMIPTDLITVKLQQLFDKGWKSDVWDNFTECLNEDIN